MPVGTRRSQEKTGEPGDGWGGSDCRASGSWPPRRPTGVGSGPRKRDLAGGSQVGQEVADLVIGQGFQQALGHQGDGGLFA